MSRLEEAVRHDLERAPEPPAIELVARRSSRRRARHLLGGAVPALLIAVAVVVAVASRDAGQPVNVATVTTRSTTSTPTTTVPTEVTTLPIATAETFPGLSRILNQVRDEEQANGTAQYGEIVATTRDKTFAIFGGRQPIDTRPMYLVRLVGTFVCNSCNESHPARRRRRGTRSSCSSRAPRPHRPTARSRSATARSTSPTFGPVYLLPGVGSAPAAAVSSHLELPATTLKAGASMRGSVVVENRSGHELSVKGCTEIFQVALGNDVIEPGVGWQLCLRIFTIPTGASSYPITVEANYPSCAVGGRAHRDGMPSERRPAPAAARRLPGDGLRVRHGRPAPGAGHGARRGVMVAPVPSGAWCSRCSPASTG